MSFTPPLRQLAILGVITSDFSLWVDAFEQFAGRFVIRVLWDKFAVNSEIKDFAFISNKLDEISLAIDSLNLWVDKTAGEQGLNIELLREEKKKQK